MRVTDVCVCSDTAPNPPRDKSCVSWAYFDHTAFVKKMFKCIDMSLVFLVVIRNILNFLISLTLVEHITPLVDFSNIESRYQYLYNPTWQSYISCVRPIHNLHLKHSIYHLPHPRSRVWWHMFVPSLHVSWFVFPCAAVAEVSPAEHLSVLMRMPRLVPCLCPGPCSGTGRVGS